VQPPSPCCACRPERGGRAELRRRDVTLVRPASPPPPRAAAAPTATAPPGPRASRTSRTHANSHGCCRMRRIRGRGGTMCRIRSPAGPLGQRKPGGAIDRKIDRSGPAAAAAGAVTFMPV
jgi:hypothetical protein